MPTVILDEAEELLDPVSDIDGFILACLVDASTGMVLASRKDHDETVTGSYSSPAIGVLLQTETRSQMKMRVSPGAIADPAPRSP